MNKKELSAYMSKIGEVGGTKSRRTLTTEQARKMVEIRESKRARMKLLTNKKGTK